MLSLYQLKGAIKNKNIPAYKLNFTNVNQSIQYILVFVPGGGPVLVQYHLWPVPVMAGFFGAAGLAGKTKVSDLAQIVNNGAISAAMQAKIATTPPHMSPSPLHSSHRSAIDEIIWRTCGKLLNVT